jgi:excisionase family DNA binding protein
MPSTYITTQEELKTLVEQAVVNAISDRVPEIIRKASRKEWLTTKDAMELLDCSRRHLFHLRNTNQISFHQNGRKILFHIDEIEKYLEENRVNRREE